MAGKCGFLCVSVLLEYRRLSYHWWCPAYIHECLGFLLGPDIHLVFVWVLCREGIDPRHRGKEKKKRRNRRFTRHPLVHRWALECTFHRVSFLIPQAASIYLPHSFRCCSTLCASPEKGAPHIKRVIKAGLPLRGWSRARDVNVSAPAVIDASSCRITVLLFASVEHSCDYSAAT